MDAAKQREFYEAVGIVRALSSAADARAFFEIAGRVFANLIAAPGDGQRRRLKLHSPAFKTTLGRVEHGQHVLATLGWCERDGYLRYDHSDLAPLHFAIKAFEPLVAGPAPAPQPAAAATAAPAASPAPSPSPPPVSAAYASATASAAQLAGAGQAPVKTSSVGNGALPPPAFQSPAAHPTLQRPNSSAAPAPVACAGAGDHKHVVQPQKTGATSAVPPPQPQPKPQPPPKVLTPYERAVQELSGFGFSVADVVVALKLFGAVPTPSAAAVAGSGGGAANGASADAKTASAAAAPSGCGGGVGSLAQQQSAALELLLACDGKTGEAQLRAVFATQRHARDEQRRREEAASLAFVKLDEAKRLHDQKLLRAAQEKESEAAIRQTLRADLASGKPLTLVQYNVMLAPAGHHDAKEYTCNVCFCEYPLEQLVIVACGHWLCRTCMTQYMKERIDSGRSADLACPEPGCKRLLTDKEVGRTVDRALFERYLGFLLEAHLKLDPDCRWCPKAGCGLAMIGSKDHPMTRCPNPKCGYCFCFNCKVDWHADVSCENYKKWQTENAGADSKFEEWKKQNTKPCPKCAASIQKNGGCNHMTCVSCRYEFCWLCGEGPYKAGHFTLWEKSPCYGKQYT